MDNFWYRCENKQDKGFGEGKIVPGEAGISSKRNLDCAIKGGNKDTSFNRGRWVFLRKCTGHPLILPGAVSHGELSAGLKGGGWDKEWKSQQSGPGVWFARPSRTFCSSIANGKPKQSWRYLSWQLNTRTRKGESL